MLQIFVMRGNWFDDPFFNDGGREDAFGGMDRMMRGMHEQMERMMNGAFGGSEFVGIDDSSSRRAQQTSHKRPTVEEVDESGECGNNSRPREPIVEEPDEPHHMHREQQQMPSGYCFSSVTTSFSGPDGVVHTTKRVRDSSSGKDQYTETRKIGDKSITFNRETDGSGQTVETETRHNIYDNEADGFQREWERVAHRNAEIGHSAAPNHSSAHRYLK